MGWSFHPGSGRIRDATRSRAGSARPVLMAGAIGLGIAATTAAGFAAASASASVSAAAGQHCRPGSGPRLAGRHLTAAKIARYGHDLTCANLRGADLSGLSLVQIDFTGANMRSTNLQDADLTQATLSHADLSGANLSRATMIQVTAQDTAFTDADLSYAKMGQAEAPGAQFHGANLSHADLGQANLVGADLSGARLTGTSFAEAELGQATFTGAKGLRPWSMYLLLATAAVFVLLLLGTVTRIARTARLRALGTGGPGFGTFQLPGQGMGGFQTPGNQGSEASGRPAGPPMGGFAGSPMGPMSGSPMGGMSGPSMGGFGGPPVPGFPGPGVAGGFGGQGSMRRYARSRRSLPVVAICGLIGAIVVAAGFHLFAGGLLNQVVSSFGPPLAQVCTGALCKVGVAGSVTGIIAGAVIAIVGFGIRRV
jgi:uncharacterized protein YjbI with pentapeptide repeats